MCMVMILQLKKQYDNASVLSLGDDNINVALGYKLVDTSIFKNNVMSTLVSPIRL